MANRLVPIKEINSRLPKDSRLTAIEYLEERGSGFKRMVKCRCKCGEEVNCALPNLLRGNPKSCGCLKPGRKPKKKAVKAKTRITHG